MVRSAIAEENLYSYLTNLAKPNSCTVGLILGQPTLAKDFIIHFAKTPPYQGDAGTKRTCPAKHLNNFADVIDEWVADHAKHATRMLPGGMYVLGIFIVSQEDLLTPFSPKIKSVLNQIHKQLNINEYLYGNPSNSEKLILNYCIKTQQLSCKSYDVVTSTVKPAEIKFQPKATKWQQLECKYELDQLFSIGNNESNWPLKKHMTNILNTIRENLMSAVFLYDGEIKDGDENLESIGKKKKVQRSKQIGHTETTEPKAMQVSIFLPCDNCKTDVVQCEGHIRVVGQIACKLWLHPKATISSASECVTQDLIRSLAARLEMHWDSLIEEEHGSPEDTTSIHEPPRRVLVALPSTKITLSDYLFPGEGPQEAQISLQEMLDIKISEKEDIEDVEGQADLTEYYSKGLEAESEETLPRLPTETHKFMYIMGSVIAFLVLIISLVIHYLREFY